MATKVYGASDDLIEIEGDIRDEVNCYGTDDQDKGVLLCFSDGTVLEVKYGKNDDGIWEVKLRHKGTLFVKIDPCESEDADPHSDVAYFKDGLKWCYASKEWEKIK